MTDGLKILIIYNLLTMNILTNTSNKSILMVH